MRHRKSGRKLGRRTAHRQSLMRGLVTSLIRHERIQTTDAKAKELRRLADRMITFAKRGDLHARRLAARMVRESDALAKLFSELGPRFQSRSGGYTRIIKIGYRQGDDAPISFIEFLKGPEMAEGIEPVEEEAAE